MTLPPSPCLTQRLRDGVLTLSLNAANAHNPFSAEMERAMTSALRAAADDPQVGAVVIFGGHGRSFSVGGDFNEVKEFQGGPEVDRWIDDIVEMYVTCLEIDKPTVAALDQYAIGIGFQLALCCDYRIGTPRSQLIMPELKNGIACVLGQYMLEKMVGRAAMLRLVIECDPIGPDESRRLGLLNEVVPFDALPQRSEEVAARLLAYARVAFATTKKETNRTFVEGLRRVTPAAQSAHRAAFKDRAAQRFMNKILAET